MMAKVPFLPHGQSLSQHRLSRLGLGPDSGRDEGWKGPPGRGAERRARLGEEGPPGPGQRGWRTWHRSQSPQVPVPNSGLAPGLVHGGVALDFGGVTLGSR